MLLSKKLLRKCSKFIYPNICLHCKAQGDNGMDLCQNCFKHLPWIEFACQRCALPLQVQNSPICGACTNRDMYFEHAIAPFLYKDFIKQAIREYKFKSKLNYGKLLAQLYLHHIETQDQPLPDVILPVPLHRKRLRQRGYNQALEIARILGKEFTIPIELHAVKRIRETRVQMELPAKQRQANVKNAFQLDANKSKYKNKYVVIFDDVMTTGNTVNEVAKCFRNANVKQIDVWCIARVT